MDQWYYAGNGAQQGPVTLEQLQGLIAGNSVAGDALVWCEGMPQWTPANQIESLKVGPTGVYQPGYEVPQAYQYPQGGAYGPQWAGFWLRFAAAFLDGLILTPVTVIISLVGTALASSTKDQAVVAMIGVFNNLIGVAVAWLYAALFESSEKQATLGKMACGIRVCDMRFQRITFGRATGRFFGKYVSYLTLFIGFMMAGWTEKKQALHDMIASTLVVRK